MHGGESPLWLLYHRASPDEFSQPNPYAGERVLEFDQLRQLLAIYTGSPLGHERVMQLTPSCDCQWIERQQQLVAELRGYLRAGGHFDFHGLLDPTNLVNKSRIRGAALEIHRDSRPVAGSRPRRRVAGDRAASAGRSTGKVAGNFRAVSELG